MIRILVFFVVVAALAALAVWLADAPGHVEIAWRGYVIGMSPAALVGFIAAVAAAAIAIFYLVRAVWIGPRTFARARRLRRERTGHIALTRGLVAVAAGDAKGARRLARRANMLLGEPPLTLLLSAQAAQLEGDETLARGYFEAMLERPETEFLGIRGLLVQANRLGDRARALELAERAQKIRPQTAWVLTALIKLQTQDEKWAAALETVRRAVKAGAVPDGEGRAKQASLHTELARSAGQAGDYKAALKHAQQAMALDSMFIPAKILAARAHQSLGKRSAAQKLVSNAWSTTPHPHLARIFLETLVDEAPLQRMKQVERLAGQNLSHLETHLLLGEAALDAKLWGTARNHLEAACAARPSNRAFRLRARLEEAEHGDAAAARAWLLKASESPPEPAWVCSHCTSASPEWSTACPACGSLDTIQWREPRGHEGWALPKGVAAGAGDPPGIPEADPPLAAEAAPPRSVNE